MTYQDFLPAVCQTLQAQLGSGIKLTVQDIIKNNGTHLDGLTILAPQCNVSPTIYLNHCFRQYQEGASLTEICHAIIEAYQSGASGRSVDVSFFTDYNKVKSKIIFKLVNYEQNKELLSDVPHYRFLDLAIIFNCLLESGPSGNATILIHNHHLALWNITDDDLYALAQENTPLLLKYDLRNMSDVLKELFAEEESDALADEPGYAYPMYVLSNRQKLNGSVCILYQDLLKNFSDRLNSDLYIIPSSIHEVLLIPACGKDSSGELSDIIREVNASQLAKEDILSEHVYYFSRETCRITM